MRYVLKKKGDCAYCGMDFEFGDEIRETPEGEIHDDCFYDWARDYANRMEWHVYTYGSNENYERYDFREDR